MSDQIRRPGSYSTTDALAKQALQEESPVEDKDLTEKKPDNNKTPLERWREALTKAEITEEEADKILDSVLSNGYYEKMYPLFKGRLRVTLRSRDSASLQRVSDALDTIRTNDPRVHAQTMNRYNLAASLSRYQDTSFKHPTSSLEERENAFAERLKFVDNIPVPVLLQLYNTLQKFDNAVFAALSEGAEMGF
jgi:hypothetical protein